MEELITTTR